jgi:universal stress protein A
MLTVRSILCPVDFSEQSRQALLWASAIAQYRGGELTVVSVVEPLLAQAARIRLGVDLARTEAEPALREFVEATLPERVRQASHVRMEVTVASGQRMLARLSASLRDTHSDCVVSIGRPADTIASLAVEYEAGLVVMGLANPEDSEVRKPGSIAYRVLRIAHVAVVVVPALRHTPRQTGRLADVPRPSVEHLADSSSRRSASR